MQRLEDRFVLIVIIVLLCALVPLVAVAKAKPSTPVVVISDQEWAQFGQTLAESLRRECGVVTDAQKQERVKRLAGAIGASYAHEVTILNSDAINAFCGPDGWIFVNNGLIDLMNDAELAFVMAHEARHAANRDPEDSLRRALQAQLLINQQSRPLQQVLASLLRDVLAGSFSRDQERRADREAIQRMIEERFDPNAAVSFFAKLANIEKEYGVGTPRGLGKYLATHPPTEKRIELAKRTIEKERKDGLLKTSSRPDSPLMLVLTVTSPGGAEIIASETKDLCNELQRQGNFEFVLSWRDEPEIPRLTDSSLANWARNRQARFLVLIRMLVLKEEIRETQAFFGSKYEVTAKLAVESKVISADTGEILKLAPTKEWSFEQKSTRAREHYFHGRREMAKGLAGQLLTVIAEQPKTRSVFANTDNDNSASLSDGQTYWRRVLRDEYGVTAPLSASVTELIEVQHNLADARKSGTNYELPNGWADIAE